MGHKRTYVRVPITGEATLSDGRGGHIKASTIDISPGGLGVVNPENPLGQADYRIEVTTADGEKIELTASLIRKNEESAGFRTSDIDEHSLEVIANMVAEFQTTEEFIKQIAEHDLLQQSYIDEEGNEFAVTFEVDPEK